MQIVGENIKFKTIKNIFFFDEKQDSKNIRKKYKFRITRRRIDENIEIGTRTPTHTPDLKNKQIVFVQKI